jgi:hypothetical protein
MAVADGQRGNAAVFNAAFVSKSVDSEVLGKITLNADDSGAEITNLQLAVNLASRVERATQTLAATDSIDTLASIGTQLIPVQSTGGEVELSATPLGNTSFSAGIEVILIGLSDTNFVTLKNSDTANGVVLNGQIELKKDVMIRLVKVGAINRWVELCRNS